MRILAAALLLAACAGASEPAHESPAGTYEYSVLRPNGSPVACTNATTLSGTMSLAPAVGGPGWYTGSGDFCGSEAEALVQAYVADGDATLWFLGLRMHGVFADRCIKGQVYGAGGEGVTFTACKPKAKLGKTLGPMPQDDRGAPP